MAFAINKKDRPDLSNEICHQLQLKKTKEMLYVAAKVSLLKRIITNLLKCKAHLLCVP